MIGETPTYVYGVARAGALRAPLRAQGCPTGITGYGDRRGRRLGHHRPNAGPTISGLPRPELLLRLAIHQRLIEGALKQGDVLPAQFGAVLSSEEEIRALLTGSVRLVQAFAGTFAGLRSEDGGGRLRPWSLERSQAASPAECRGVVEAESLAVQARRRDVWLSRSTSRRSSRKPLTGVARVVTRCSWRPPGRWRNAFSRTPTLR